LAGVSTTGAQTYNGDLSLAGNLSGQGLQISGDVTLSGADRTLTAGSGAFQITGQLTGDGHAVNLTGTSVTLGDTASGLSSLSVTASSIQLAGASTTGAQTYTGSTTLAGSYATQGGAFQVIGDTQLGAATSVATQGGAASFGGTLDGASNLSVNTGAGDADFSGAVGQTTRLASLTVDSAGATRFGGAIRAASLSTDAAGTLAMDGGSVNTTGTQTYGERLVLGADTVLTGSTVTLNAGVDAATSAGQTLIIAGDAVLNGHAGAQQALGSLHITGSSTLASGGSITTMGDQQYDGAVQLLGNQQLRSVQGDLRFLSTLDGSDGANLTLTSEAGAIALAGAVGGSGLLGALTVSAATTLDFSGAVHVDEIATTDTTGLTRFLGSLQADGVGGISLSGGSFSFAQTVTASQGALTVANTDASGTLDFAAAAHVHTATGFVQTGGAGITLPASVLVDRGPITLAAPATLPTGAVRIETEGDITLSSLIGTSSQLTLASGHGPVAGSGLPYSLEAGHLQIGFIDVAGLTVTDAKSAELFGRIAGKDGALAASLIDTRLVNAPYFINGTPWGPLDVINTLVATTVPRSVVASTPGAGPLFTRTISSGSLAPDALSVFAEPQVLSVPERDDKSSATPL
ncbi:beta strand repeat-containing protein, partial [Ideonella sp.]|uniref:beta strand repeat-containing protein n=1 Tax=Ideonella sp. TaxID=1929293 RepID=UPI003BB68AB9